MNEETVVHCNLKENALLIALILDADAEGRVFALDFYEKYIAPTIIRAEEASDG